MACHTGIAKPTKEGFMFGVDRKTRNHSPALSVGMSLGAGFGGCIGVLLGEISLGVSLGMMFGISIGLLWETFFKTSS